MIRDAERRARQITHDSEQRAYQSNMETDERPRRGEQVNEGDVEQDEESARQQPRNDVA